MEEKLKNDLLYVCTLIEYVGRITRNHRGYIVQKMGEEMIAHQLEYADINHCLSLEQVAEEVVEDAEIEQGAFDTVKECVYSVPSPMAIGKVYQRLIWALRETEKIPAVIIQVFDSFLSDRISDFNCSMYYSSPSFLLESFRSGRILDD